MCLRLQTQSRLGAFQWFPLLTNRLYNRSLNTKFKRDMLKVDVLLFGAVGKGLDMR